VVFDGADQQLRARPYEMRGGTWLVHALMAAAFLNPIEAAIEPIGPLIHS
jgi:hypothetical protein